MYILLQEFPLWLEVQASYFFNRERKIWDKNRRKDCHWTRP